MNRARHWMRRIIPGRASTGGDDGNAEVLSRGHKHRASSYDTGKSTNNDGEGKAEPGKLKQVVSMPAKLVHRRTQSADRDLHSRCSSESDDRSSSYGLPMLLSLSLGDSDRPGRPGRRKGDHRGFFSIDTWRSKKHFRQLDEVAPDSVERELFRRLSRFAEETDSE